PKVPSPERTTRSHSTHRPTVPLPQNRADTALDAQPVPGFPGEQKIGAMFANMTTTHIHAANQPPFPPPYRRGSYIHHQLACPYHISERRDPDHSSGCVGSKRGLGDAPPGD